MSFISMQFVFFLLISSNYYVFGLLKLPICQCECCPGEQCQSQLLVYSVDQCNATTCSFEQCYHMYPKKCGLTPGITHTFCEGINQTTTTFKSLHDVIIHPVSTATSNTTFSILIYLNSLFIFLFKF